MKSLPTVDLACEQRDETMSVSSSLCSLPTQNHPKNGLITLLPSLFSYKPNKHLQADCPRPRAQPDLCFKSFLLDAFTVTVLCVLRSVKGGETSETIPVIKTIYLKTLTFLEALMHGHLTL